MMMRAQCVDASQYMWDLDQEVRSKEFECKKWFNAFRDTKGYQTYKSEEAIARKSYSKLKRALIAEQVQAGGSSEPPEDCDAHHIVPENEKRKFAEPYASDSRQILKSCNIDINSAENGVFLPRSESRKSTAKCEGKAHMNVHGKDYYVEIYNRLRNANEIDGCSGVVDSLKSIKVDLINQIL